ncbi:DUF1592 domain-containing protein [Stieleria marina]|uniref:Planctomycete cytochrome C n=1 Tax=Stieleria marina TaxID=1930275 RepID=A0A517NPK3_9BACT|nr:hypothetical protein K239x_09940 [Planctomycetes bacterium K23_9]
MMNFTVRFQFSCRPKMTFVGVIFSCLLVGCIALSSVGLSTVAQAAKPEMAADFLRTNCLDCHDGESAEAAFDVSKIKRDLSSESSIAAWIKIVDRVNSGEMPPADYGEVDAKEKVAFVGEVGDWLRSHQKRNHADLGRVQARRLTNLQLERTLQDLLAVDLPLASMMPEEQRTEGFTNIADTQSISHFQLETHLQVVDAALDAAFGRATSERPLFLKNFSARELCRNNPRRRCREPESLGGKAVVWSGGPIFYGRLPMTMARRGAWYRFTFTASALNSPKDHGVWCSVRTGQCTSGAPLLASVGSFEATEEPKTMTMEAWIPEGHMLEIRPADSTLKKGRFQGGQVGAGEGTPQNISGLALHSMQLEEIRPFGDVQRIRDVLFGDDAKFANQKRSRSLKVSYDDPKHAASKQLRRFARRAFRRPVEEIQLQPYLKMLHESIADGVSVSESLYSTYRAVLCSPRFMYFSETPGELDDYAVASRLSYLFWNSMPDWKLFGLSKEGKLRDPGTVASLVDRMLATRRGKQFVTDFTDHWLDLIDINFTEPDRKRHGDFDVIVQDAMLGETRAYLASMLQRDAPVSELIKSRHTFLNSRLARYYDIDGVQGDQLRKVSLTKDSHRGGLLAQGAILKVTANGTNTSPVLRGVWLADRILGTPIPPPPSNVPAIEPDIRGAKTIRQMLAKHRESDSCASCHRKIDPAGFALEHFDAAGKWRDRYFRVRGKGLPIESADVLLDGREFDGFDQFRDLIAAKPEPLARNFVEKLIVYGTGAAISFADREEIDRIVEQNRSSKYGVRSLLTSVVTSSIFLSK